MMIKRAFVLGLAFSFMSLQLAAATTFTYDLTFDGTNISIDGGSDTPAGSVLVAGDDYVLSVSAAGDDFWRLDAPLANAFIPLSFLVLGSGTRTGDIISTFFLDGVQTAQITELGVNQANVHIGAQSWTSLAMGVEFDTVVQTYILLASTAAMTTIQNTPDIFGAFGNPERPFFRDPSISYVPGAVPVPVPAAMPLMASALAGMGFFSRRKKPVAAA